MECDIIGGKGNLEINMNRKPFGQMLASIVFALFLAFDAHAWMDQWAPAFKPTPADVQVLPGTSVSNYVCAVREESEFYWEYCKGYALDLNGDGIKDRVFILPWMGNGLAASGSDVHFIVSTGAKGWKKTVMEGYGVEKADLVKVAGKTYFRHSEFFEHFEKSQHNHWVYQMFSFDKSGAMKCSNGDFGKQFPAVTIFYNNPKFRQIELTQGDLKKIADKTKPTSR